MGNEETVKRDEPKVVRKTNTLLKWLGGIAAVPLIGILGNLVISSWTDQRKTVDDLKTRLQTLEDNSSSKEAIWNAISQNRDKQEAAKDHLTSKFNEMAVKYQAAMLVFERQQQNGGYSSTMLDGPPPDEVLEMFAQMLDEVQKAEETDKAEIERLKQEIQKMKTAAAQRADEAKQHAQLIDAIKAAQMPQQMEQKPIDPKQLREAYEREFPNKKAPDK